MRKAVMEVATYWQLGECFVVLYYNIVNCSILWYSETVDGIEYTYPIIDVKAEKAVSVLCGSNFWLCT